MLKNNYLLPFISLTFISFFSVNFSALQAQTISSNFNQPQCVNRLVKEGVAKNQAEIWCSYEAECLVRSQKEGLPLDSAKNVCDCSIKEFRKRYTADKFKQLNEQAKTNQEIANQLREVGETCFENLLFAE